MLWLVVLFPFAVICLYCIYDCIKPKNYPPGPAWLPLVGCIPTLLRLRSKRGLTHLAIRDLQSKYGPVLGLKLGNQNVVVISTYDLIKKAALYDEFNNRPDGFVWRMRSFGKRKGVLFIDGVKWAQCRKFVVRHFRTFGLSNSIFKERLTFEIQNFLDYLEKISRYGAVQMNEIFSPPVLNIIWFMIAGHRYDYDDEKLLQPLKASCENFRILDNMGGIITQMPLLRYIIPELSGYNVIMRNIEILYSFINEEIKIHEKELSNEPRDLIDAFLLEIAQNKGNDDTIFERENLMVLVFDLFMAGSETTSTSLNWAFLYLSLYPEWLKILRKELDTVVGISRAPTEDDLLYLPMVEAYLAEMQRYLFFTPFGIPHSAAKDVLFNGYLIPKDAVILFDYYSFHRDEMHWDKPDEFRPQRFLNEHGQFDRNNINAPFGLGKRRCLGEMLARSSLFLFFVNIVHYFDIELSPDHEKPDLKAFDGFTLSTKPYYLKFTKRFDSRD